MADERGDEGLERAMNELSESVLRLASEDILAESIEAGSNPQELAERTRLVLQKTAQRFESLNRRISDLGHTVNPKTWRGGREGYQNRCLNCGATLTFALAGGEVRGSGFATQCPASGSRAIVHTGSGS